MIFEGFDENNNNEFDILPSIAKERRKVLSVNKYFYCENTWNALGCYTTLKLALKANNNICIPL